MGPRRRGASGTERSDIAAFLDDEVVVAEVKCVVAEKAEEIGWNNVPRPAPEAEAIYRVIRAG